MKEIELLQLFLPEGILTYFEITKAEKTEVSYKIHLSEKNILPEMYQGMKTSSKGFYEEITIQDLPIRGKACFLKVKRRRWLIEDTGKIVSRDWNLVAKGTRFTSEFATFLKGINR